MGGLAMAVYDFFDIRWGQQAAQGKLEEQDRTTLKDAPETTSGVPAAG